MTGNSFLLIFLFSLYRYDHDLTTLSAWFLFLAKRADFSALLFFSSFLLSFFSFTDVLRKWWIGFSCFYACKMQRVYGVGEYQ